ncbi:hypothetical protein [Burkholderia thailandensis]|uniref:hypothetical protein n=1 Tax=Burkholderia thailandensis TaxID=57975 RepID=UPI0018C596E9|nr:hypothetical protein [Burkholderia thailandensis]
MSRTFKAPAVLSTKRCFELIERLEPQARLKAYKNEGEIYYVQQMRWDDDDICCLLINKCDKLAADPCFSDPQNLLWRAVNKLAGEGMDYSCHIIVKASTDPLATGLAIVEAVQGMPPPKIQQFLNALMRSVKEKLPDEFKFTHPSGAVDKKGDPATYNAKMMISLDGHVSESLEHDLTEGAIGGVELITERNAEVQLDQAGFVREKKAQLEVSLSTALAKARKVPVLRAFLNSRSGAYEKARIRFTTDTGDPRTVTVRSGDFTVGLDTAYVKRAVLNGFNRHLGQSYTELNEEMLEKLKGLLI